MGRQIIQWEMPLLPRPRDSRNPIDQTPACTLGDLMFGMPTSQSDVIPYLLPSNPWARAWTFPDFMTLFQRNDLAVNVMKTFPMPSQFAPKATSGVYLRCIQKFPGAFDVVKSTYSPACACDEHLVFTSCEPEVHAEVRIHLAPTNSTTKPVGCVKTKWMELHQSRAIRHMLCPVTGRHCILTANNEIVVLDFLEDPTAE
ncbi:hypothetical protein CPB83DRAFT_520227 [Crepidotus variabilis]|uniref:Uncharacterized protein n=1 Tax=Crepidotus variabilis TaxID=179855 RepID=A0A9P6EA96_9AGAR|nr:hypothetical protein CPB83DRAFT_520227 [Crepidotus variabilis]